jgi:hypothetical protein
LLETKGAASAQGFGLTSAAAAANYIEDCFSVWLYTGTSATQTITNGIDLSTKGGLVWIKERSNGTGVGHYLFDTARGLSFALETETAASQANRTTTVNAFNSNGFSMGSGGNTNNNGTFYASWTFRKQPKFFDVVTYTGNGSNRTITHNLGSVPGCIIVKRTDTSADWQVYHRSNANTEYMVLNSTAAKATGTTRWNSTTPTSTEFSLGTDTTVNASGGTYVAYLFAHDAGGFGASGTDNVISCGSFTTDGSGNATVTLGYEPQFLLTKSTNDTDSWLINDQMRGWPVDSNSSNLSANTSTAEVVGAGMWRPRATGFVARGGASGPYTYIYIAIRRGPMRTPTTGTSVYQPVTRVGSGVAGNQGASIATDSAFTAPLNLTGTTMFTASTRLTSAYLYTADPTIEQTATSILPSGAYAQQTGFLVGTSGPVNAGGGGYNYIDYALRRAPGFFDVVCYTGTGANRTVSHNLGVVPELMIVKRRNLSADWQAYSNALSNTEYLVFNSTAAKATGTTRWNSTTPTSSVFTVGTDAAVNASGGNYVTYLFATVAGVSKVFSYTGNGSSQTINCGFTGGSRFIMIKRTDSTGDWYVWDSARGIVAGNDPYSRFNTIGDEVTTNDSVDTDSTGFVVNQVAATNVNVTSATYIGLAIA